EPDLKSRLTFEWNWRPPLSASYSSSISPSSSRLYFENRYNNYVNDGSIYISKKKTQPNIKDLFNPYRELLRHRAMAFHYIHHFVNNLKGSYDMNFLKQARQERYIKFTRHGMDWS